MLLQGGRDFGMWRYFRMLFWYDKWMGDATFSQRIPVLFQIAVDDGGGCRGGRNFSCGALCLDGIVPWGNEPVVTFLFLLLQNVHIPLFGVDKRILHGVYEQCLYDQVFLLTVQWICNIMWSSSLVFVLFSIWLERNMGNFHNVAVVAYTIAQHSWFLDTS